VPTYYLDETGFTGEDLLAEDQPIFVQASNDFTDDETKNIIDTIFSGVKADELKYKSLSRRPAHQERVVEFIKLAASDPTRVATWVAHKEFAAVTLVVEWWLEPLAYKAELNLYKDGAAHAMANMLFMCLQGFWNEKFRRKVLHAFQSMFRARTIERFDECYAFISKTREAVRFDEARSDIIRYLWTSFPLLGLKHVVGLPEHVMDLALPGLVRLGHHWRAKHEGPWHVVHDRSSNMAKQQWMWDKLSAPDMAPAQFDGPHGAAIFPMNVVTTRFADSIAEKQIQLCDIIAGATSAMVRLPEEDEYRGKLIDAGIEKLIIDSIWPTQAISPEDLGKRGWDGNKAIEYITEEMAKKDAKKV
jgi:Protein of unknown function (DUF3800)